MQLKHYQQLALDQLRDYLQALRKHRVKADQAAQLQIEYDWDVKAWKEVRPRQLYTPRVNGLNQPLPAVCFKVPTGGGKTLLAVKAVDLINSLYRREQTGLVLWIVPSTQIYSQTYRALRDRAHPYRVELDMTSGGRTLILEKDQVFSPEDVRSNLCVMLLMLPSANRQNKETLRIFKDRGGFEAFFPPEDRLQEHAVLLERLPNLDCYGDDDGPFSRLVKSSLGNTLRLLQPVIVLDEGHKTYGELAQSTLRGFNPSFLLELTATPPKESNSLVRITGQAVLNEGMIKLPIQVHHRLSADWHDALLAGHFKRVELEDIAREYENRSGDHIRPINLIQVERTGEKQRKPGFIHAEEVREYLIAQCNVSPEQIAVKSSDRDEIENIDLLERDCPIRYIITKQALQEGWDCPFAYVLTTLINTTAAASMTQLVGRVLRQPYAHKTEIPALDESYVFAARQETSKLVQEVYAALHGEGLDDVTGGVTLHDQAGAQASMTELPIRPQFEALAGKVYLPCFVVADKPGQWREVGFEMDILSRINFEAIDLSAFDTLELNPTETSNVAVSVSLDGPTTSLQVTTAVDLKLDLAFITRQLLDVVPNPWVGYAIAKDAFARLRARPYTDQQIQRDLGFVIAELKKVLVAGRNAQAEKIFRNLLDSGQLRFLLISGCANAAIPDRIRTHSGPRLRHSLTDEKQQLGLFDYPAEDFNETEAEVALYLDQQQWVLWWFRNVVKHGYSIQGWQPQRIYPDFVVGQGGGASEADKLNLSTVQVMEIKGLHLAGNTNTDYKRAVFQLCNEVSQPRPWDEVAQQFVDHQVKFHVVDEDEWRKVINALFADSGN